MEIVFRSKQTACAGAPDDRHETAPWVFKHVPLQVGYLQLSSPSQKRRLCALPRLLLYVSIIFAVALVVFFQIVSRLRSLALLYCYCRVIRIQH